MKVQSCRAHIGDIDLRTRNHFEKKGIDDRSRRYPRLGAEVYESRRIDVAQIYLGNTWHGVYPDDRVRHGAADTGDRGKLGFRGGKLDIERNPELQPGDQGQAGDSDLERGTDLRCANDCARSAHGKGRRLLGHFSDRQRQLRGRDARQSGPEIERDLLLLVGSHCGCRDQIQHIHGGRQIGRSADDIAPQWTEIHDILQLDGQFRRAERLAEIVNEGDDSGRKIGRLAKSAEKLVIGDICRQKLVITHAGKLQIRRQEIEKAQKIDIRADERLIIGDFQRDLRSQQRAKKLVQNTTIEARKPRSHREGSQTLAGCGACRAQGRRRGKGGSKRHHCLLGQCHLDGIIRRGSRRGEAVCKRDRRICRVGAEDQIGHGLVLTGVGRSGVDEPVARHIAAAGGNCCGRAIALEIVQKRSLRICDIGGSRYRSDVAQLLQAPLLQRHHAVIDAEAKAIQDEGRDERSRDGDVPSPVPQRGEPTEKSLHQRPPRRMVE